MEKSKLRDFERELRKFVKGDVYFDKVTLGMYSTDASIYQITPVAVVIPVDEDDVRAAVAFVRDKALPAVDLAGYSFGAWVNAGVAAEKCTPIESMMMVSPPVGFIEFENDNALSCLKLVVTGSRDDIAPPDRIRALLPTWNPDAQFEIIDGCDHFYSGQLDNLQAILTSFLQSPKKQ